MDQKGNSMKLRDYQEDAADFLFEHDRAMMLAWVGAGKTAATLTAMQDTVREGLAARWLVVAPKRVATTVWPVEQIKWAPKLKLVVACGTPKERKAALYSDADVVVTNYDNLQWLAEQTFAFDAVVFDELTKLKNPSGKRFKAMEKLLKSINIRWGLTGSFTSNGLEDVFGQCKIVDQKLLGRSKGAFMQQYFLLSTYGGYDEWTPRPGSLELVMQRIKPATYVLEPGVYTDTLPPLHTVTLRVDMEMTAYETMKKDFIVQFPDAVAIAQNAAVVTQKLQQMASGFVYTPEPRWMSWHKFDALDDLLSENQHVNTIIVYNYKEELAELKRRYPHLTTVDDADAIERWNSGVVPLLALHPKSAGHGLNLQHGGRHMVFLSLPWSLELYEQTVGRLHRSGQRHDVWCYVLMTENTIDERIWAALHDKRAISNIAMEELK
jgi:SNF2 family DNA or RNA helicase